MYTIRCQIERLSPDRVKVPTIEAANLIVAAMLQRNQDRDVRVTITSNRGEVVAVSERKVSTFTPSQRRQAADFYR